MRTDLRLLAFLSAILCFISAGAFAQSVPALYQHLKPFKGVPANHAYEENSWESYIKRQKDKNNYYPCMQHIDVPDEFKNTADAGKITWMKNGCQFVLDVWVIDHAENNRPTDLYPYLKSDEPIGFDCARLDCDQIQIVKLPG